MSLKKLFSEMRKRSASNHEDDELSESTDVEPVCKHPRIDSESECRTTESDSTTSSGELSLRHESSTSALKNKKYKQNMGYKPEYKRAHWWVRYDESPGTEGMFCSVCEKWADIPKGNRVHQTWIKAPSKHGRKQPRNYESMNSLELTKMPLSKRKWLRKLIGMEVYWSSKSQQLDDNKKQKKIETGWC